MTHLDGENDRQMYLWMQRAHWGLGLAHDSIYYLDPVMRMLQVSGFMLTQICVHRSLKHLVIPLSS